LKGEQSYGTGLSVVRGISGDRKGAGKRYPEVNFVGHEVFGQAVGQMKEKCSWPFWVKIKQNRCDAVTSGVGC